MGDPSSKEAEVRANLWIQGQPGLHSEAYLQNPKTKTSGRENSYLETLL